MALWVFVEHKDPSPYLSHFDKTDEILQYLRKKKIDVRMLSYSENINRITKDKEAVLLFPSDLLPEHTDTIIFCNKNNIPVFVLASSNQLPGCYYSSVGGDPYNATSTIVSYLQQHGKTKIAYFGSGTKIADISKISSFYSFLTEFNENDVYFRFLSLEDCFEQFFERRHEYNTVICSNDLVAIFFIEKMKEADPQYLKNTFVISYMNSVLSQVYHTPITSASYLSEHTNLAVVTMYRSLSKSREYAHALSMTLKTIIYPRETTDYLPYTPDNKYILNRSVRVFTPPEKEASNYHDPMIQELLLIESMLRNSSKTDLKLMLLFLQGKNQEEAARELFVAIQTIRYRSGIIFKKLGVKNKKAFISLLCKYISTENLRKYIQSIKK